MSSKEIQWSNEAKIEKGVLEQLEIKWNIRFPAEYANVVLSHDGSSPNVKDRNGKWKPGLIKMKNNSKEWFTLLSFQIARRGMSTIEFCSEVSRDALPDKIFPFADNGAGDSFLFDFRKNMCEPSIVFLDHDREITENDLSDEELEEKPLEEWQNETLKFVCNSFSELLDLIVPREE